MRKLILSAAVAAFVSFGGFAAPETNLTTFVVSSGETLEIGGTQGADPDHNKENKLIDLREGATLQMKDPPNSGKTGYLWATLICTNGPATFVLGDAINNLIVRYNFIVRAPGSLVLKSANCRAYDYSADSGNNNFPHYDLAGVTYQDLEGGDVTAAVTNNLDKAVILSLPDARVTLGMAAGKTIYLGGENMFPGQEVVAFGKGTMNYNLYLLNPNVFTSSQKVTLGQWRTLFLKPIKKLDYATTHDRVWSAAESIDYDFDVEMLHSDAKITVTSWFGARMKGKVSGGGTLYLDLPDADNRAVSTSYFTGDLSDFTGSLIVSRGNTMVLNCADVKGLATLYHEATLKFPSPAEGGPANVSVANVALFTNASQPATISIDAGQTLTIGEVGIAPDATAGGFLKLVGDAAAATDAIDIAGVGADGANLITDGSVKVTFGGKDRPDNAVVSQSASDLACFLPNAAGEVAISAGFARPLTEAPWYYVLGDVKVTDVPEGYGVRSADESSAPTLLLGKDSPVFAGAHKDMTVKLVSNPFNWQDKALLWLDPSDETTVYKHYHSEQAAGYFNPEYVLTVNESAGSGESGDAVEGIADKRGAGKTTMRAWNARSFQNFKTKGYEDLTYVHPFISTAHATNGKAYLSFGKSTNLRRLQFADFKAGVNITNASHTSISPKFAVMVYGSHNGGGYTMLGTKEEYGFYYRGGNTLDDPITKAEVDVWMNGRKVDLGTDRFSGGWDVISIDLSKGPAITTLGMDGSAYETLKHPTGMNYGEIVFFSEVLTDDQRIEVERYLADGWGLADKYEDVSSGGAARLAGSGTVEVSESTAATVSGTFAGTLSIGKDAVVTMQNGYVPYTEDEIQALNPALWIDPSLDGVLTVNNVKQITWLWQHDPARRTNTDIALAAQGTGRAPIAVESARAFGPERTWIDFNGTNEVASSNNGNTLRMYTKNTGTTDQSVAMRTGFIVQDSVRGGGTPFLDAILGGGKVKFRATSNPSEAIYASGTTDILKKSPVYLNDKQVDYTKGFSGGPEVFTFTASEAFSVGYFAYLGNSQGDYTYKQGEIQSEILLFADLLGDEARQRIDAYLMNKWLGYAPEGCVDFSSAKIDGTGDFVCADGTVAPSMASAFSGKMTVTGDGDTAELKVNLVTVGKVGALEKSWVAPDATMEFPAKVTVTVNAIGKPRSGRYPLIDVKSLSATEFSLNGDLLALRPDARLIKDGNMVMLDIPDRGLAIIIR